MKLDNPFPPEVRNLFLYVYSCFSCGRSDKGLELHHITGRDSSSAFNACPICTVCHAKIGHTQIEERRLFDFVQSFLLGEGYQPVQNDFDFCRSHPWLVLAKTLINETA